MKIPLWHKKNLNLDSIRHTCGTCGRKWYFSHDTDGKYGEHRQCALEGACQKCRSRISYMEVGTWWWDDTNDFALYVENVELGVYDADSRN